MNHLLNILIIIAIIIFIGWLCILSINAQYNKHPKPNKPIHEEYEFWANNNHGV
jgi:hypothetical protein